MTVGGARSRRSMARRSNAGLRQTQFIEQLEQRACPAAVSITGPAEVDETARTAQIFVMLSEKVAAPVTVSYSLQSTFATATYGRDYRLFVGRSQLRPTGTLTFRAGQTSQVVTMRLFDDTLREGNEHFTMALQGARNATLNSQAKALKVTIKDNDNYTVSIVGPARVTAGTTIDYRLQLSSPATRRETFYVSTRDGTAKVTQDYRPLTRVPVTILPGKSSALIRLVTVANPSPDYDKTVFIDIVPATPGFPAPTPFTTTIPGPLGPRPVEIAITKSVFVREGQAGRTSVNLTATLSNPANRWVSVQYATRDGSATAADLDYVATTGLLTFAPGQLTKTFTVFVNGDVKPEEGESFFVDLSMPQNVIIKDKGGSTIVTIQNDDSRPDAPNFDTDYGYGIVDAARAVAHHLGLTSSFPAVPDLGGNEWGNDFIKSPEVWAQGITGQGVVVAVVDTGVDYTHPDLYLNIWINQGEIPTTFRSRLVDTDSDGIIGFRDLNNQANRTFVTDVNRNGYIDGDDLLRDRLWTTSVDIDGNGFRGDLLGWNFIGNNRIPSDSGTHGTHVAGTIGATRNTIGHTGVAYNSLIMAIQVLGPLGGTNSGVANGIRYAAENGAHVINLSLGGPYSGEVESAIVYATGLGAVVVAAAGNDAEGSPGFPARLATMPGVISVGAVDRTGTIAGFSHLAGTNSAMKHIMAPGVDVFSTFPGGRYEKISGTSMATPHVAGMIALMLSARDSQNLVGRDAIVDAAVDTSLLPAERAMTQSRAAMFAALGNISNGSLSATPHAQSETPMRRFRFSLLPVTSHNGSLA